MAETQPVGHDLASNGRGYDFEASDRSRMHDHGPKICLIGAGGMSFGPVMVLDAINTPQVGGATMMLHDVDPGRLENARRFATRANERRGNPIRIEASLDPAEAMTGADFCLTSAEVGRWEHWIEDYEIPCRFGASHITGENGGPGACSTRCGPSGRCSAYATTSSATARRPS